MTVRPRTAWFLAALKYFLKKRKRKRKEKGKKKEKKRRKKEKEKKKKKKRKKRKKRNKNKRNKKTGEFSAGQYPPGIESRNTTPDAINGLVEVKKASFLPSSTNPYGLAHTESRARDNGCARVACV